MTLPAAASVLSSGLGAYPTIYYDRVAIETLRSNLFMYPALELKQMPDRSGVAMQIFQYTAFAANTTPATEGTPGAGQPLTQNPGTINLSQYVDYVSFSDKVVLTGISDTVAEGASELSYRGALSVDTVVSTAVDAAATVAERIDIPTGSYLTTSTIRRAAMSLRSVNVKPKDNGLFMGLISSLAAFDVINDATAGGFIDLRKYTEANAPANLRGIVGAHIGQVGGVDLFETNSLPTESNWQASGLIAYHSYVFGKNAFIGSSLGKTKLDQKNFGVKVSKFQPGTVSSDPAGQIAAAAAYNFFFGLVKRPGTVNGFRQLRAESSIG